MRHRQRVRTFGDRTSCHIMTLFRIPSRGNGVMRVGTRLGAHFGRGTRTRTFLTRYGSTLFAVTSMRAGPLEGSPTTPFAASALRRRTTHGLKLSMSRAVAVTRQLCRSKRVACVHASSAGLSALYLNTDGGIVMRGVNRRCRGTHGFGAGTGNTRRTRRTVHPACVSHRAVRNASTRHQLCSLV